MEYEKYLSIIASAIAILGAAFALARWIYRLLALISEELWKNGFPWKIKGYVNSQYIIEGWEKKEEKLDKLIAKLLLDVRQARMVLVLGESGAGKSYLCVKSYHRLIFRTVVKGQRLKYVNAAMLENFDELKNDPDARKKIIFLDGLDRYHEFLKSNDPKTTKEIYYNLHKALSEYGRVVIAARSNYYRANKDHVDWVCYHLAGCDMEKVVKITLTGLEDRQVKKYLKWNLKLKDEKIKKCIHLVHSSREILSRPIFLQFLEMLPEEISYSNSYVVYEEIVKSWMQQKRDKPLSYSGPIVEGDVVGLFNQLTERYFAELFAGKASFYFQAEEVLRTQLGAENPFLSPYTLLKYDLKYGYYCIHPSFFEFNYVRLHYKEMCRRGMKEKKFMHGSLKSFYEECHYNRTFVPGFPQAEVVLLKSGKKNLSELRPEEPERIVQIRILHAEDLLHPEFRKFIQGFYYSSFMLGLWKINNGQLRMLLQNNYLNLSGWKIRSARELDWFHGFPVYALNLSHTGIRRLDFLDNFPLLKRLIAVGNLLESVMEVGQCANLSYINFSNCGLVSHALLIRWPDSLRKLVISNNEISDLDFLRHVHLEELDISDNPLQGGAEALMDIPGRIRCVYHFASDALKALILNQKRTAYSDIQYDDMMSFLRDNGNMLELNDEITSIFGLENIHCEVIMFPLGLIPLLNALSRPLHTNTVTILSEQGYKLGYILNNLFSKLSLHNRHRMTLEYAFELRDQCGFLIDCLADYTYTEGRWVYSRNNALEGMMDTETFQLCMREVILVAAICLKYIRQCGTYAKEDFPSLGSDELVRDYASRHSVPNYLGAEDFKNLSEQQKKFMKQGKVFEEAINTIQSNSKGLLEIIWSVNEDCHIKIKNILNLEHDETSG